MPDVQIFMRGDQIATFDSLAASGAGYDSQITLSGLRPLGTADQLFRVTVSDVGPGNFHFASGQTVEIYAWPDAADGPSSPIYSALHPHHDAFDGRASSAGYQIITEPAQILFQVAPITGESLQFGPGPNPDLGQKLPFKPFPPKPVVPCFTRGTLITTEMGLLPVEAITPGMRIQSRDNGWQQVIWSGERRISGRDASTAPIRFETGSIGNHRPLLVSPQHRMLISGWQAEVFAGTPEVFAAALHLQNGTTIRRQPQPWVSYFHLLCEGHQIIEAEGAAVESLYPGDQVFAGFDCDAQSQIRRLCPDLGRNTGLARPVMTGVAAKLAAA